MKGYVLKAHLSKNIEPQASSGWIDISVPLWSGMVHWPSDPPVRIQRVQDMDRGDSHTLSEISMGTHTGTHIDAPLHFIKGGLSIAQMPVDVTMGRARVLEIRHPEWVTPEELVTKRIRRGERILLKTQNSTRVWSTNRFIEDFVSISRQAADFLASRKIRVVGVDYLSASSYQEDGGYVHRVLLGAGIWIIEGLNLNGVSPGRYDLVCLPLRIDQGDGAPARAALKPV